MPPPKLLLVMSEQRSGSTFLSEAMADALPCALALGEPFAKAASGGGFARWPFAAALDAKLQSRRLVNPYAWLMHVRAHACANRTCACIAIVKVFRTHGLWSQGLRAMVRAPEVASVLLVRNAVEAECSRRWAVRTGDWANSPQERQASGQAARYSRFRNGCALSARDLAPHTEWVAEVRRLSPILEGSFEQAVQSTTTTLQRVAAALGVVASPWVAPQRGRAPTVATTLGLISIVRRHVHRLAPWLAHHAHIGVDEVALYSTLETRRAVAQIAAGHLNLIKLHRSLEEAVNASGGRQWSYSWKECAICCRAWSTRLVRDAPAPLNDMCERRMYMPEQAHVVRDAVARLKAAWLLHIDVDEYLVADGSAPDAWRAYLATLGARARVPGGVHVPQIQMLGSLNETEHLVAQPNRWQESKCLVRKQALHEHPHAFGSVHHVTLKRGEFYVRAPSRVLALLHYRYLDWRDHWQSEVRARLSELGCGASRADETLALICKSKHNELTRWAIQRTRRVHARLDAARAPRP